MPAIAFLQSATGASNNGGDATLTLSSASSAIGNSSLSTPSFIIVTLGTSRTTTLTVTTSSGGTWSQIGTTTTSSYCRSGVFASFLPALSESYQATVTGSGGSSDSTNIVAMMFDNVNFGSTRYVTGFQLSSTPATGQSTQPDSPSVSISSASGEFTGAVASFMSQEANTPLTAPSGYGDAATVSQNDTLDATTGMAWVTYNSSTDGFTADPGPWASNVAGGWVAWTLVMDPLPDVYLYQQLRPLEEPQFRFSIVGY